jgi:hypothetical protein
MTLIKPRAGATLICIRSSDDNIDLTVGKVYQVARPESGDGSDVVRVLDDSGCDYLYPLSWFVLVTFDRNVRRQILQAIAAKLTHV